MGSFLNEIFWILWVENWNSCRGTCGRRVGIAMVELVVGELRKLWWNLWVESWDSYGGTCGWRVGIAMVELVG